jgi:uncharacterized protein
MATDATRPAAVPSPCVRNCCLDDNDICLGCNRSLTEICGWTESTDDEKREILERCRLRAQARQGRPPPGPAKPW